MTDSQFQHFDELCQRLIDERATEQDFHQLEQLVLNRPELKKRYAEFVQLHASLSWRASHSKDMSDIDDAKIQVNPGSNHQNHHARAMMLTGMLTLCASVVLMITFTNQVDVNKKELATLTQMSGCQWGSSTQPIREGGRLSVGTMNLVSGIAKIHFDQGVELILEAPTQFDILSAERCLLHSGRLVANVSPGAEGFQVETPTSLLTDRGTSFGVHVRNDGESNLVVFDGVVDAEHRRSHEMVSVEEGLAYRFDHDEVEAIQQSVESTSSLPREPELNTSDVVQISTAIGAGKDAYVDNGIPMDDDHRSNILLLVKHEREQTNGYNYEKYERRAYLGFDLTLVDNSNISHAQLRLYFAPTNMGFASAVPDCTFIVYGITDESVDNWQESELNWDNAPANYPYGEQPDPNQTIELGRFEVPQWQSEGSFGIEGTQLTEFLKSDTNGLATLMITRETGPIGPESLVHGFASRRHPEFAAPNLRLTLPSGNPVKAK